MIVSLKNVGKRPATDLRERIIYFPDASSIAATLLHDSPVSSIVPTGGSLNWKDDAGRLPKKELQPQYLVVGIKYEDSDSRKPYSQVIVLEWVGKKEGKTFLRYASREAEQRAISRAGTMLAEYGPR